MLHRALDESFPAEVRHRITILTIARTMANGCFRFAPPFLATIARSNGTTLAGIGVAVAISELSGLLSPLNGEIVERLNRRTAMATGLTGVAVGATIAASSVQPWMFAIGLVLLAQSKVMFDLGLGAWTSDRVPYAQRGRVMGLTETSWAFGLLIGVTTMGLVTAATNWRVGYGLGAAAVLCMAGVIARGIAPDSGAHTSAGRPARTPVQYRELAVLMTAMFCLMGASQSLFVTFGSWLDDSFGFSPATLSAVAFGMGFGELAASITSSRRTDGWGKERSAAAGAAIMVPAGLGLALWHEHLAVGLPLLILAIAAFEFAIVSSIPLGTAAVPGSPARGMALMMGTGTVGRAAVSLGGTWAYSHHGMAWPAMMCASLASITVVALLRLEHRRRATTQRGK
ncbi:MAG: MFS transporter [Ilumatobacteraceae bacterium]